ncbi:MAG: antitoxin [Nostocoides sp.]
MDVNDMLNKAKEAVSGHADQAKEAIDKAGDFIDEKTGGKFSGQVDQGQDFVKDQLGLDDEQA